MNYRDFLQKVIYVMINPLIKAMIKIGITPNIVTLVGFIGNILLPASLLTQRGFREWAESTTTLP